jgi:hypothetical protein
MNDQGQALIETAVFFMALSVLLAGLAGFTKWFAARQEVMLAAKEGALLYSSGHWKRSEVEARMRQSLVSGVPQLNPEGINVSVHPKAGLGAWFWELDESVVEYTPPLGWGYLLGADLKISEKFVVKHAPTYGPPYQRWYGPAVPYGS